MSKKLYLTSIYFGNLFEHYDTALYSLLAPFFATLFFPERDELTALILTFGIVPLGMMARPIGSLVFGYMGDFLGRSRALFFSLMGMAVVTAFIGFLPNGWLSGKFAPLLLLFTRILQNFFAAGENIGGAVCFLESLENEKEKDFASSVYGTSIVAGILLASGMVTLLYHFQCIETGWRWLYICGSMTALCGVIFRIFAPVPDRLKPVRTPPVADFLRLLWDKRSTVFTIALASGFSYATYNVAFTLMNGFIPLVSSITQPEMTKINTTLLLLDMVLLPIFGSLTGRFCRTNMMLLATLTAILSGMPLFYLLDNCSILLLILVRTAFMIIGVWFSATFHSWAQNLVSPEYRYSLVSFSYALGSQFIGNTSVSASLWFFQKTNLITSVSWYWILLAGLTFCALRKEKNRIPQNELQRGILFVR